MQKQKNATLKTIFSEVLADLAFMFTDNEDIEPSPDDVWLEATISYDGSVSGTLRFHCTGTFSVLLAANLLGTSPDDENAESNANDAVKEFMNIVCGQFITATHGTQDIFNVTIPQIIEIEGPPDLFADDVSESSTFSVDGHQVQLSYIPGKIALPGQQPTPRE